MLKERYDNKRVIVHTHVKAIMDKELPSMHKETLANWGKLRMTRLNIQIHALRALNRPIAQWDDLLIYILPSNVS